MKTVSIYDHVRNFVRPCGIILINFLANQFGKVKFYIGYTITQASNTLDKTHKDVFDLMGEKCQADIIQNRLSRATKTSTHHHQRHCLHTPFNANNQLTGVLYILRKPTPLPPPHVSDFHSNFKHSL